MFNSFWNDCSTVGSMVSFNKHDYYSFFFLCWYDSATVAFTVEESRHVPGIRQMIHIHFLKWVRSYHFIHNFYLGIKLKLLLTYHNAIWFNVYWNPIKFVFSAWTKHFASEIFVFLSIISFGGIDHLFKMKPLAKSFKC